MSGSNPNQAELIKNFVECANCPEEEARRYLEAANWDSQVAMDLIYGDTGPETTPQATRTVHNQISNTDSAMNEDSDDEASIQSAIQESLRSKTTSVAGAGAAQNTTSQSKIRTFGSLKNDECSSDEEGQAFYAGGSERSGQQIIGPNKERNVDKHVSKIFEAAKKQGAVEADEEDEMSLKRKKEAAFTGVGYRLGDDTAPSQTFGQPMTRENATNVAEEAQQIPLRFFSNGFTVGDGELRRFEDNQQFMEHIKRGEVPPELRNLTSGGRHVEVRLEDHRGEEYKPKPPTFKAFVGTGHMLGSPAPNVVSSTPTTTNSSASKVAIDDVSLETLAAKTLKTSSRSTMVRLRLPDVPAPVRIAIDLDRTINDLRKFLRENVPSLSTNMFEFIEPPTIKIKPEDELKTIEQAKLNNANLVVRKTS